jgi:hypothetical protein
MDLHTAYLVALKEREKLLEQLHWQRLIAQAKRENRSAASRPRENVFWTRAFKRVTSVR